MAAQNPNPLGRAVRKVRHVMRPWVAHTAIHPTESQQPERGSSLRELVFGANDGLVSNVALVAGIAGGTNDSTIILLGGIAGLVAGGISMSLGAYVSSKTEHEFREAEEQRERWEVENMRDAELQETRHIFRLKGISEPLLDDVVEAVSRDPEQWVKLMMTEELGFANEPPKPKMSALIMGFAFAIAAAFPVAPYLFVEGNVALIASVSLTITALFGVGALRASLTAGSMVRKGTEMVVLGGIAVIAANLIGRLVGVTV